MAHDLVHAYRWCSRWLGAPFLLPPAARARVVTIEPYTCDTGRSRVKRSTSPTKTSDPVPVLRPLEQGKKKLQSGGAFVLLYACVVGVCAVRPRVLAHGSSQQRGLFFLPLCSMAKRGT